MNNLDNLNDDMKKLLLWIYSDNMDFSSVASGRLLSRDNPNVTIARAFSLFGISKENIDFDNIIDESLKYALRLISTVKKPYDLSQFDSVNEYINHSIAMMGNVIFTFNGFLLSIIIDYCIANNKSFYSEKDNEKIKANNIVYNRIKNIIDVDPSVACINTEMSILKDLKCLAKISDSDLDKQRNNINKIKQNSKILKITNYIDPILDDLNSKCLNFQREMKIIEKQCDFSQYPELNKQKIHLTKGGTLLNADSLNDEQLLLIAKHTSMTENLKLFKSIQLKLNETIKELDEKKSWVDFLLNVTMDRVELKNCYDFFSNLDFIRWYNDILLELKTNIFTPLDVGMENMFSTSGNKNSLVQMLDFLCKEKIIPEYIYRELGLYEILVRHQYSHGWHFYFNILTEESRNYSINLNNKLEDMLISNDGEGKKIKDLRASFKSISIKNWSKKFYYLQFGIEENVCKPINSLFNLALTSDEELVIKFKTTHTLKYLEDIYDFCINNNSNVFDKKSLLREIEKRKSAEDEGHYYMSLHSLISLIITFSLFHHEYKTKAK